MSDNNSKQTRRNVLQKGAVAGAALTLGGLATGSAAADKPKTVDFTGTTLENPCTEETMTVIRGEAVFDLDIREDQGGGLHGVRIISIHGTLEGQDTGQLYQGSFENHATQNGSPDGQETLTRVVQERFISRGSEDNFLAKTLLHFTFNADRVETVNIEMESVECL